VTTETTTPAVELDAPRGVSQAALFAREYAKNAARNMLDTIAEISGNSARITKIAMGVSMPHQIGYILALAIPHLVWDLSKPAGVLESITMVLLAVGVPIATDLLILNCIKIVGAIAASAGSKKLAMSIMLLPVAASGAVNVLAPAPALLRFLAGFIVTVIPMSEALRAFTRPDFAKIERMEMEVESQLTRTVADATAPVEVTVTIDTPDHRQLNKQRMLSAQKARELAQASPGISLKQLMGATGCGRGAAKKALELAKSPTDFVDEDADDLVTADI
jgi:hypothetical protein